jgi:hypothetical protein
MAQYLLAIYRDTAPRSHQRFQQSYGDVNALADELAAAGGLVFAGGLDHSTPTVIRSVDGAAVTTDGPFAETKEQLGGFWIVEVADVEAARGWGARLALACGYPVEVSTFEPDEATVQQLLDHTASSRLT